MSKTNITEYSDHIVAHAERFRNATAVVECKGAISLHTNGTCIRCGYPTVTQSKPSTLLDTLDSADSNRLYSAQHSIECAECGHVACDMDSVCDCCARGLFLSDLDTITKRDAAQIASAS